MTKLPLDNTNKLAVPNLTAGRGPVDLLDTLCADLRIIAAEFPELEAGIDPETKLALPLRAPQVIAQLFPRTNLQSVLQETTPVDDGQFPFILVCLMPVEYAEDALTEAPIDMLIGTFSQEPDGWRDGLHIAYTIANGLLSRGYCGAAEAAKGIPGKYRLQRPLTVKPLSSLLLDKRTDPAHYVHLSTRWEVPNILPPTFGLDAFPPVAPARQREVIITTPPTFTRLSSGRTANTFAPFAFSLEPAGVGNTINLDSVQVMLDGVDISGHVRHDGTWFTTFGLFALAPLNTIADLTWWAMANYWNNLRISPIPSPTGGASGVALVNDGDADTAFTLTSPVVAVEPGAEYALRISAKHQLDLSHIGAQSFPWNSAVIWFDEDLVQLTERTPYHLSVGDGSWHTDTIALTAPAGAYAARVQLGFDAPNITGSSVVEFADVVLDGPHPVLPAQPNLHRYDVSAADRFGNTVAQSCWLLVKPEPTTGVVSVDDSGNTRIDDEPFFPLGIFNVWQKDDLNIEQTMSELATAGFNSVHTYHGNRVPAFAAFTAAAHNHGLKFMVAGNAGDNLRDPIDVLYDVALEANTPNLLAWYLADDTAGHNNAGALAAISSALTDIDPAHLTAQADSLPEIRLPFVQACGAYLPEIYPFQYTGVSDVPRVIHDMKAAVDLSIRAGAPRRPVWALLQAFSGWGWQRFPTFAETRAAVYLALIHGANGLWFYTYTGSGDNLGASDDSDYWDYLCFVTGQVAFLLPALTAPAPSELASMEIDAGPLTDARGYPSISLRLLRHGSTWYLLAANSSAAPVTASLFAPNLFGLVTRQFEATTFTASGVITDTFEPYGVHVYAWTA